MRLLLIALLFFVLPVAYAEQAQENPRFLVHLLDYLAQDYGGAVEKGHIKNPAEYKEQVEFSETARRIASRLPELRGAPEVHAELQNLGRLIAAKAPAEKVAASARRIQGRVLKESRLSISPAAWPDQTNGAKLFAANCAACHGATGKGDGPGAAGLDPKPADLVGGEKMPNLSPFQVFNSIRLGVPGTAMAAQSRLSDKEIWDLAFYVVSLQHHARPVKPLDPQSLLKALSISSSGQLLEKTAIASDTDLSKNLKPQALAALRLHSPEEDQSSGGTESLGRARRNLKSAMDLYRSGKKDAARQAALAAYLEGVEPVEARLRGIDSLQTRLLEERMGSVREQIDRGRPTQELKSAVDQALLEIERAEKTLLEHRSSSWLAFLMAAGILLREGFEAVLVVVAFLSIIRASGSRKAEQWVHVGWAGAVALGVVTWFFSGWLMGLSGAGREMLEASTSAFAVVVLLYFGLWLHGRTEIEKWKSFLQKRTKEALEGRSLLGLAGISFLAVFREVFETVLFLQAAWLESGAAAKTALLAGVVSAFIVVLVLGYLLVRYSAKLPIKKLFSISSALMVFLAIILAGKAVHAFQEAGVINVYSLPLLPRIDLFGIFPNLQGIAAQILVLGVSWAVWTRGVKKHKR